MPFEISEDLLLDVQESSAALGRIAEDEAAFALLVQSFRAQDREGYYEVLKRFEVVDHCELICNWLCATHCAVVCFNLCGPPLADDSPLSLGDFGLMIQKLSGAPELLDQVVATVLEQDADGFQKLMGGLGWERYCHYICHWICSVRCQLVCRILCGPRPPRYLISNARLVAELRSTAGALAGLVDNPRLVKLVEQALVAQDYDAVRDHLQRAGLFGGCQFICLYLMVWRCVRVCLILCRDFQIEPIKDVLPQLHGFARALPRLADDPEALRGLVLAMGKEDPDAFAEHIKRLEIAHFCHWFCFWICRLWFRRFCIWLCPPVRSRPWFTHVGDFHIYSDIAWSTTGLTVGTVGPAPGHGGSGYAFFGNLELRGYCPVDSPVAAGAQMEYRFVYELDGSTVPLLGSLLYPVLAGSRRITWDTFGTGMAETFQSVWIAGANETPAVTPFPSPLPPPGTPWGGPPAHVIIPGTDGWIKVDPAMVGGGISGALIGFNTGAILPGGEPVPGVVAGENISTLALKAGKTPKISFEARRVDLVGSAYGNALDRIRINNWYAVRLHNLAQFVAPGATACSALSNDLDVLYTVDHEYMLDWSIVVTSASFAPPAPSAVPVINGAATRGSGGDHIAPPAGATPPPPPPGTQHVNISSWAPCSYTVTLTTRRKLTTGLIDDGNDPRPLTFCIGPRALDRQKK